MKIRYYLLLPIVLLAFACQSNTKKKTITEESKKAVPEGVTFNKETLKRLGASGDNWCLTWTADGSQMVSMCDGNWLDQKNYASQIHNHLYRIKGGPENFEREDLPNYPEFSGKEGSWFGYGIVAVNGTIYSAVSKTPGSAWSGPFTGVKLLKSTDNGESWSRVDREGNELLLTAMDSMRNVVNEQEMFSLKEHGLPHQTQEAYPFSFFDFVQNGKDNSAAKDEYVYIYSPEGAAAHQLTLARVPHDKIDFRSEWQYFTKYDQNNEPQWSNKITDRGYVHTFPEKSSKDHYFGWYSWLPSVVWNEGLGLYIMVNGGTYGGHGMSNSDEDYYHSWMHTETGSLGFWYSENAYGPWTQFYYTDYWTVDDTKNRTYQPKLSPKWISEDGEKMNLIWSDAMKNDQGNSHSINYIWNQMEIEIKVK
ncbi:DUF4185 domain-containing protein [Cyclobacterium qasimii]|nr:DUF4185 domain-containing protein [Cyclobacterium qasimii]